MDEIALKSTLDFLGKYNNFLVVIPEIGLNIDKTVASLALCTGLDQVGKKTKIVTSGQISKRLDFIESTKQIGRLDGGSAKLTLSLNTTQAVLGELSYEQLPGQVNIYLQAKNGKFNATDITVQEDKSKYEAVITLGAETLEQLGQTFSANTELFYSVPRLNLDVNAENQLHGTTNVLAVTSSSVSELVYQVLVALKEDVIPSVATLLLTGLLSATSSLKNNKTTPKAFAITADLTAAGGDYTTVVKYLYKNERLGLLKLWGRSLAKLTPVSGKSAAYVILQQLDFVKTGENSDVIRDILSEFDTNVHDYKNIIVAAVIDGIYTIAVLLHPQLVVGNFIQALNIVDYKIQNLDSGRKFLLGQKKFAQDNLEEELIMAIHSSITA